MIENTFNNLYDKFNNITNKKVNLLKISDLPEELILHLKSSKEYPKIKNVSVNFNDLNSFYQNLSFEQLKNHIDSLPGMDYYKTLKKCSYVENDRLFFYNVKYCIVFNKMASEIGLGNPDLFWDYWYKLNSSAMQSHLKLVFPNKYYTSIALDLKREKPYLTDDQVIKTILEGAELRAKRAYCAMLRELYVTMYLTRSLIDSEGHKYDPLKVLIHPILDSLCRIDALIVSPKMGLVGLAIHLNSKQSNEAVGVKSGLIPIEFRNMVNHILGFGIDINYSELSEGRIILPSDKKLLMLRKALEGEEQSYNMLVDAYTWKNEQLSQ